MHYIPYLSTIVTFAFTAAVFRRYLLRRGPHLLIWSIGLLGYGLGTLSEVILGLTFSAAIVKLWYLAGAMISAAWLGQGTLHLLVRRRGAAWAVTGILAAVSLLATALIVASPITPAAASYQVSQPISSQYQLVLGRSGLVIALTILLNIYGSITMVGGALYSAFIFWRKRVLFNRMIGNILIAAGALAPAIGGSFVRAGLPDFLYLTELVGAILMYIGFLQATTAPATEPVAIPAQ